MAHYEFRLVVDIPEGDETAPPAAMVGRLLLDQILPPLGLVAYERFDVTPTNTVAPNPADQ